MESNKSAITATEYNDVENWFKYHPGTPELVEKYNHVREVSKQLALWIYENVPNSADRTAAIRSLRRTVMDINLAIACNT